MHLTLSATGLSILSGFVYRYYSLKGELKFFHQKKTIAIIGLVVLLYPVQCLIPNWIEYKYSLADAHNWVQTHYPEFYYVFTHWTCSAFYDESCLFWSIVLAMIQILFIAALIMYYFRKCVKLLNSVKGSLTAATYALQKQLLVTLCLQMMVPICCLLIPITVLFVAMLAGSTNMTREYGF